MRSRGGASCSAGVVCGLSGVGLHLLLRKRSSFRWQLGADTGVKSLTHRRGFAPFIREQSCWQRWCDWSSTVSPQYVQMAAVTGAHFMCFQLSGLWSIRAVWWVGLHDTKAFGVTQQFPVRKCGHGRPLCHEISRKLLFLTTFGSDSFNYRRLKVRLWDNSFQQKLSGPLTETDCCRTVGTMALSSY